jgi:hypothetical protein
MIIYKRGSSPLPPQKKAICAGIMIITTWLRSVEQAESIHSTVVGGGGVVTGRSISLPTKPKSAGGAKYPGIRLTTRQTRGLPCQLLASYSTYTLQLCQFSGWKVTLTREGNNNKINDGWLSIWFRIIILIIF